MLEAILIGLIAGFGSLDYGIGSLYANRPIVLGPLVGLVLGDLQQGIVIGATLELFFMGAVSIGAYIPPDVIVGGVLATAFSISLGQGTEVALALAMPIALLALAINNMLNAVLPLTLRIADEAATQGDDKKIIFVHHLYGAITVLLRFTLVFFAYRYGAENVEILLAKIPDVIIDGMEAASGLLPALGFAMLLRMIYTKELSPYYFIGFVLSAFLGVPILAIAILGLCYVLIKFNFLGATATATGKEPIDNEF